LIIILSAQYCFSQNPDIYGYIFDKQNDSVISGANVTLISKDDLKYNTVSDSNGYYAFDKVLYKIDSIAFILVSADDYLNEKVKLDNDSLIEENRFDFKMTLLISRSYLPILYCGANTRYLNTITNFKKVKFIPKLLKENEHLSVEIISYYDSRVEKKNVSEDRATDVLKYLKKDSIDDSRIFITHVSDTISEIRFNLR
jgi:hypothetical protein